MKITVVLAVLFAVLAAAHADEAACEGCQTLVSMNQLLLADADMDNERDHSSAHNACAMLADVHVDIARNCVDLLMSGSLHEASDLLVQHGDSLCAASCQAPAVHYLDDDADTESGEKEIADANDAADSKLETDDDSELDADDGRDPLSSEEEAEENDDHEASANNADLAVGQEATDDDDDDDDDDDEDESKSDDDDDEAAGGDLEDENTGLGGDEADIVKSAANTVLVSRGEENGWKKIRDSSRQVTCHAADNIWVVGDDDRAYRYAGKGKFLSSGVVHGGFKSVKTSCQSETYALSNLGAVFKNANNQWVRLQSEGVPDGGFRRLVIGNDGEVFAIGKSDHFPYQYDNSAGSWKTLYKVTLRDVAVTCDHHVIGIGMDRKAILLKGKVENTSGKYRVPVGGTGFDSVSGFNEANIYGATKTGAVYRLAGNGRKWKILPLMRLTQLEVGTNRVACGIFNGKVYIRGSRAGADQLKDKFNPEGTDHHSTLVRNPFAAEAPQKKANTPLASASPGKDDLFLKDPLPFSDKYKHTNPTVHNWNQFSPEQKALGEPKYNALADPLPAAEASTVVYQKTGDAVPPAASHAHTWNNGEMKKAASDHQVTYPQPSAESPSNTFQKSVKEANYNLHDPAYSGKDTKTLAGLRP